MHRRIRLLLGLPTLAGAARPAAICLAALFALTVVSASHPAPARADPVAEGAVLTVDPTCEPTPTNSDGDTITVTVRGYSFQAGRTVTIYWNGPPAPAPADAVTVGPAGSFEVSFTVTEVGSQSSYGIDAWYQDSPTGDAVAYTSLNVPCPGPPATIRITPDCGNPSTPVLMHLDGSGFQPDLAIAVHVYDLFSESIDYAQVVPTVPPDPNAVSMDFSFTVPAAGAYRVVAAQTPQGEIFDLTGFVATAYFVAPCSQFTVTPTCAQQGSAPDRYSIQLSGTGFQPQLPVTIVFDAAGQPQYFYGSFPVNDDGSWGPAEINPYARGPGTYDVVVTQSNDGPTLHQTHATFTVECSVGAVTLDPPCASPQFAGDQPSSFTLTVSGVQFQAGLPVTVTFDPDQLSGPGFTPETAQATTDGTGGFSVPLTVAARPANTYRVSVQQQVGTTLIEGVVPPFSVPCTPSSPTLTAKPKCGADAALAPGPYSISLVGKRFIPGLVQIVFDVDGSQQPFQAEANANGRFTALINPTARPPGTYRIEARQQDVNQTLLSDAFVNNFVVPCSLTTSPTLTIDPGTIAPGFVVEVQGAGFPAGKAVELRWNYGINASRPIELVALDDGSFDLQVLIFAHDLIGPRQLTAGTPTDPKAFPDAVADLLVAAGQGSPPGYVVVGGGSSDPGSIVLRR